MKPALPWRIERFERNNGDDKGIQIKDANNVVIACNEAYYPTEIDLENATIITTAVNAMMAEPHCPHHDRFDIDCLECSDALSRLLKAKQEARGMQS